LLPLAKAGLLNEIYTTGITDPRCRQSLSTTRISVGGQIIYRHININASALNEVNQSLINCKKSFPDRHLIKMIIKFCPWRGDFTRASLQVQHLPAKNH